jgi:hypothetical protein
MLLLTQGMKHMSNMGPAVLLRDKNKNDKSTSLFKLMHAGVLASFLGLLALGVALSAGLISYYAMPSNISLSVMALLTYMVLQGSLGVFFEDKWRKTVIKRHIPNLLAGPVTKAAWQCQLALLGPSARLMMVFYLQTTITLVLCLLFMNIPDNVVYYVWTIMGLNLLLSFQWYRTHLRHVQAIKGDVCVMGVLWVKAEG